MSKGHVSHPPQSSNLQKLTPKFRKLSNVIGTTRMIIGYFGENQIRISTLNLIETYRTFGNGGSHSLFYDVVVFGRIGQQGLEPRAILCEDLKNF